MRCYARLQLENGAKRAGFPFLNRRCRSRRVGEGSVSKSRSKDRLFDSSVNHRSTSSFNRARPFVLASVESNFRITCCRQTESARETDGLSSVSRARAGRPPTSAAGDEALGRPPVCSEYAALALRYRFRRLATPACVSSTTTFSNLEGRVRRSTALLRQTS